jgi:protein phosphatase PTC1
MPVNTLLNGVAPISMRYAKHLSSSFVNNSINHPRKFLLDCLKASPNLSIPDVLNQTFHNVDAQLSRLCEASDGKIHSGCTAVTAFLRIEDAGGKQSFISDSADSPDSPRLADSPESSPCESGSESLSASASSLEKKKGKKEKKVKKTSSGSRIKNALKSLSGGSTSGRTTPRSASPSGQSGDKSQTNGVKVLLPPSPSRRVLYTANAGDARAVLCRSGKAVRLTYDHKGSDKQEAKRITDAGGFVLSGRVNGVLAVTRSLGDSSMKEFVVGSPYTTETELCDEDEFVILACDGVSSAPGPSSTT